MGGDTIASGSVFIGANADKLNGQLQGVGRDVDKWGRDQGAKAGGLFSGGFGKFAKGGIIAGLAIGAGDAIIDSFMDLDEKAGHFEDFADNVGMSMESLMQFSHAADIAGVDTGTLEAGLQRLRLTTEGPLDEAMMNFARRLEGVQDPGERARILFDTFGKSGVKMGTLFAQGADGLSRMRQEATDLGLTLTKTQAGQIGAAADSINNAKKAVKGLLAGFLTSFAPILEGVSNFATKFFGYLKPVIDWYTRAWGQIGEIAGFVWDALIDGARAFAAWIDASFGSMFDWTGEMPTVQEVVVSVFRAIGVAASYVWDTIKAGAGVVSWVAGRIVQGFSFVVLAFEKIIGLAKHLPDAMRPVWVDKMIAGVGEFRAAVRGKGDEMVAWGEAAFAGFGNTAKVFNAWLDKSLAKAKAVKAEAKAGVKAVEEAKGADNLKFAGAVMRHSTEAFSVELKNQFRDLVPTGGKAELAELKKIRKADEKAADKLKDIDKKFGDLDVK